MRVLVVGGGGREHAIAWKLSNDSVKPEVFCAPGNAGTALVARNVDVAAEDVPGIVAWCVENRPDLTVVGPEVPLCAGLADLLMAEGLRVFGPTRAAAQIEGSKVFAKDVMEAAGVPTAKAWAFTDADAAKGCVREMGFPIVVKADGLAAGKGVLICRSVEEADRAISDILVDRAFGDAGAKLVVEEFLDGEEASILALVDGKEILPLASSQDHKRALDGDLGLNTGGMGAYSPAPVVSDALWPQIMDCVLVPTVRELARRGITYRGVLYAGLMITATGIKVLEFNCRFGDPETQAVLPRIDGDLLPVLEACADGSLKQDMMRWKTDPCVCVVMASGGYPGAYAKGIPISGLEAADGIVGVTVFHAGTAGDGGKVVTSGGRVLGVTALGGDLSAARDAAYRAVSAISFDGAHYRSDIGARALDRG